MLILQIAGVRDGDLRGVSHVEISLCAGSGERCFAAEEKM
jgi:hypothetical protein